MEWVFVFYTPPAGKPVRTLLPGCYAGDYTGLWKVTREELSVLALKDNPERIMVALCEGKIYSSWGSNGWHPVELQIDSVFYDGRALSNTSK